MPVFSVNLLIAVFWLDLTTYDTAKHLILKKTSLKDNPVTHTLARCVLHILHWSVTGCCCVHVFYHLGNCSFCFYE